LLQDQSRECEKLWTTQGLAGIEGEITNASEAYGTRDIYLRLLSDSGTILLSSDSSAWQFNSIQDKSTPDIKVGESKFSTLKLPGHRPSIRIITSKLGTNATLQIALSLKENDHLLRSFRSIFGLALFYRNSARICIWDG